MKISKLRLENIKCFKEVEIPFEDENGNIKDWTLIIGDNAQGKTTILRSLALGLCEGDVKSLLSELYGQFIRNGEKEGLIEVALKDESLNGEEIIVETKIKLDEESGNESIEPINPDNTHAKKNLFAVAYGVGRNVSGDKSYEDYALVDALYSLFNYEARLQNAELVARRIYSHQDDNQWEKCEALLREILMLEKDDEIILDKKGFYIKSKFGGKIVFNALSDGYQSLTSVILDLLGWKLISEFDFNLEKFSGIVIIDEIEQHLHPRWQRNIIKLLSDQFPKIQFICSSHTPICALGLNDLDCPSQLVKADYVNGHSIVDIFDLKEEFKGYRADQILTSEVFGLSDTRSLSIEKKLKKYRDIYIKEESDRNDQEKKDLKEIEDELKDLPMWEDEEDRKIRERLIKLEEEVINKTK